jgi:hypothetical protein
MSKKLQVMPLIYIQEVPGLNLSKNTSYPDWSFVVFLSPSRQMLGQYPN